ALHELGSDADQVVLDDVVAVQVEVVRAPRLARQSPAEHEAEFIAELDDPSARLDLRLTVWPPAFDEDRGRRLLSWRIDGTDEIESLELELVPCHEASVMPPARSGRFRASPPRSPRPTPARRAARSAPPAPPPRFSSPPRARNRCSC